MLVTIVGTALTATTAILFLSPYDLVYFLGLFQRFSEKYINPGVEHHPVFTNPRPIALQVKYLELGNATADELGNDHYDEAEDLISYDLMT